MEKYQSFVCFFLFFFIWKRSVFGGEIFNNLNRRVFVTANTDTIFLVILYLDKVLDD